MHKSWNFPKDRFERDAKSVGHRHNRLEFRSDTLTEDSSIFANTKQDC